MADDPGSVKWISLEAELEALRRNPGALSLLRDMSSMSDDRVDAGISVIIYGEDADHGELDRHIQTEDGEPNASP